MARRSEAERRSVGEVDRGRLAALLALHDADLHPLTFLKVGDAGALEHGAVHEDVLALILGGDEAEALGGIVPLHRAGDLLRRTEVARLALVGRAPRPTAGRTPAGAAKAAAAARTAAEAATAARTTAKTATTTAASTTTSGRRAGVDARDLRDLRTLLARRHAHGQTGAGLELAVAGRLDRSDMQEGVSGSIAHFGEAKT